MNVEGRSKRKTYTLSKERELWTPEEHAKFLECLSRFGRDWKRAESEICTKNVLQIRSHAQKYFMKLKKLDAKGPSPSPVVDACADDSGAAESHPAAHTAMVGADRIGAGKSTILRGERERFNNVRLTDSSSAAAAATATSSQSSMPFTESNSGRNSGESSGAEMRTLNPSLYSAEKFESWMSENYFLPPHQSFAQFAEAQQRLLEQLKVAQEFLQHVMGFGCRSTNTERTQNRLSTTAAAAPSAPPVDYTRVYTFLCAVVEGDCDATTLKTRLEMMEPLEQELAKLLLHQMVITLMERQLRKQFDRHAARVLGQLRAQSKTNQTSSSEADK